MRKRSLAIAVSTLSMFLILIGIGIKTDRILFVQGNDKDSLISVIGDKAALVMEYRGITFLNKYSIVFPKFINTKTIDFVSIDTGDRIKDFEEIVKTYSKFIYSAEQSDPNLIWEKGGNCQAISLVLQKSFTASGFNNGLVLDFGIDHMFNWVEVDGNIYHVDLVNKTIQVVNQEVDHVSS